MYFDTHAHYDDEAFNEDRFKLLDSMISNGIDCIVNPGCDENSSRKAMEYALQYKYIFAAVGWHPQAAGEWNATSPSLIREWAKWEKTVAIGEIGLDYHYEDYPRDVQKSVFEQQLCLALELNKPVIVHDRDAHGDCMELIRHFPELRGVFHCYSGSAEMAKELLERGWYLSFTGAITFKNAKKALETIEMMPLDRIMIETDSPYLTPVPNRGKRNSSLMLPYIAQTIANIKKISVEEVAFITKNNAKQFFGIE